MVEMVVVDGIRYRVEDAKARGLLKQAPKPANKEAQGPENRSATGDGGRKK